MPQPAYLDELQESLLGAYRRSWQVVLDEQLKLETDPIKYRRRQRLAEMRRVIEAEMRELDEQAEDWVRKQLPRAFLAGATGELPAAGGAFSQINRAALEELTEELFSELLKATKNVNTSTRKLVQKVARDQALQKAIQGKTADQAAREMRRILEGNKIHSITYSNGTKHGLAEYTQVAMRTTTAKAYNAGTLAGNKDVEFFEIFDGPSCGLTRHDDPQAALGLVVDRSTAAAYPISHPNCRRAFGPRPDIENAKQAKEASPTTTPEQRRAQLEQDAANGDVQAARTLKNANDRQERLAKRQVAREQRLAKRQEELAARRPQELSPDQQFEAAYRAGFTETEDLTRGNVSLSVKRVRLSDGTEAVVKSGTEEEIFKEAVAGQLARKLGADFNAVAVEPDTVLMTFAPGKTANRTLLDAEKVLLDENGGLYPREFLRYKKNGQLERPPQYVFYEELEAKLVAESKGSKEIGILDFLIDNPDRHRGNWMIDGDTIRPVDHGNARLHDGSYISSTGKEVDRVSGSPFAAYWMGERSNKYGERTGMKPRLTREEVEKVREAVESLAPLFKSQVEKEEYAGILKRFALLDKAVKK